MSKKGSKTSVPSKACVVCGDRALGYNFNAFTCESCKGERNIHSSIDIPFSFLDIKRFSGGTLFEIRNGDVPFRTIAVLIN